MIAAVVIAVTSLTLLIWFQLLVQLQEQMYFFSFCYFLCKREEMSFIIIIIIFLLFFFQVGFASNYPIRLLPVSIQGLLVVWLSIVAWNAGGSIFSF